MRIVINGVGIAGPTLAYWLQRTGHDVLLVESAPRLRTGGYIMGFRADRFSASQCRRNGGETAPST
jgi:2-polyprenyl-6-methoxyphenol hydroxylase-like FAD-dependent oxidoreductase